MKTQFASHINYVPLLIKAIEGKIQLSVNLAIQFVNQKFIYCTIE